MSGCGPRRIFVRPYEAGVVNKSVAGLLESAAASGQSLREFWTAMNAREAFIRRKRERKAVLIECVANAKGKEFGHVILPFLEVDEFPFARADRAEQRVADQRAAADARLLEAGVQRTELRPLPHHDGAELLHVGEALLGGARNYVFSHTANRVDVTLQEIRIECFFPVDAATDRATRALRASAT